MVREMDRLFLEMALEEAKKAMKENTYPVGAIIVGRNNGILGKGRNRVHTQDDASAHAEIDAIRTAGKKLILAKENRLPITLYTTLEPCPMCTGAILFSHFTRVVWILNDDKGFGGYLKINSTRVFEKRFNNIEHISEPFEDLAVKQRELMLEWAKNPNNIHNKILGGTVE
ncbi:MULTISPECIES: nucleoside deaminase [Bacillus]|nr:MULTISPECIES: nucleoside deaminase [Bacillus]MEB3052543.1 nucleoside deaminase [Bacillus pseudomycoides]